MIAWYARGGGLGHLTRLRAALHTLRPDGDVVIVSDSPFATRAAGGLPVVPSLDGLRPREIVVDAFPAGLKGELARLPPGASVTHLARLLRWDAYRPLLPAAPPRFDRTFILEPLHTQHEAYLRAMSDEVVPLTLIDPPSEPLDVSGWLIVHSGPDKETRQLVSYARDMAAMEGADPPLTLIAPARPDGLSDKVVHLDIYPVGPPGPRVERIITAGGFNAVRQYAPWRHIHRIMPFPRTLDDQFTRAARAREPL